MKKFKSIAMKCTQKQFDAIRPKLVNCEIEAISYFNSSEYLTNFFRGRDNKISNIAKSIIKDFSREIHETWNEKVFLDACGIETKPFVIPTLEEVKEYFKDAEEVESIEGTKGNIYIENILFIYNIYYSRPNKGKSLALWSNSKGYAKILSYKKPIERTYTITGDLIKKISSNGISCHFLMRENYPEVFENKKTELVVGKWYKRIWGNGDIDLFPVYEINYNKINDKNNYYRNGDKIDYYAIIDIYILFDGRSKVIEATEEEVTEALTKEAVKRGYENGNYLCLDLPKYTHKVDGVVLYQENRLLLCDEKGEKGNVVFDRGQWAEVIEQKPMTQAQIEKELGYKIKIV